MTTLSLTIGWLYPDLMSTYGDRGNVIVLQKRCEWRGIDAQVKLITVGATHQELADVDLIFMGGAQDKQQQIVSSDFRRGKAQQLNNMIEDNIPGLYICGAYQFLGKYYKEADGTIIDGLGILDLYTENPGLKVPRLIGNIALSPTFSDEMKTLLVGFENHGGRTYLGSSISPIGKIVKGSGNNGTDGLEGAVYKNTFGSYLHGPLLPKNPDFADYLIKKALEKKYKEDITLQNLNDNLERSAHQAIVRKLNLGV